MNSEKNYLTVSEFNKIVKDSLESTFPYALRVRGEISSFKVYPTAIYFDIKDDKSVLSCTMWASSFGNLSFKPKIGDLVDLEGKINVYQAKGRYTFVAYKMTPGGLGDALLRFEELKKKLQKEGLFDEARKRPIAPFPEKIGIISAKDSAALADLIKNINARYPICEILFFPSLVQGNEASKSLIKAFRKSQEYDLDTLIIARGGGSNEDLSAFNDETLVREMANSKMPFISAVGHEIDYTLIDYVSDLRVSTPTGAAIAATPNAIDIMTSLSDLSVRMTNSLNSKISVLERNFELIAKHSFFSHPEDLYKNIEEKMRTGKERLDNSMKLFLDKIGKEVESNSKHLEAISPKAVLARGYSLSSDENGKIIRSKKELAIGSKFQTYLKDGIIISRVEGIKDGKE